MEGNSTTPKNCVLTNFLHERSIIFLLVFSLIGFWILLRNDQCKELQYLQGVLCSLHACGASSIKHSWDFFLSSFIDNHTFFRVSGPLRLNYLWTMSNMVKYRAAFRSFLKFTAPHCILLEHYYSVDFTWWFDTKKFAFTFFEKQLKKFVK